LLDEISFEIDSDLSRALLRTRRGEIDVLPRILDSHFPDQVSPATLRDNLEPYLLHPDRYSYVVLNHRRGALSNPRFREGLSLLWDRARFSEELHHGLASPIGGPIFGKISPDSFSPTKAAALFEAAGFHDTDGDGVRDIGGEAIRFSFAIPSSARSLALEVRAFALELRRVGILLDSTSLDSSVLMGKVEEGDFDMTALVWEGRVDEDPRLWVSLAGDYQFTGYRSDAFLALFEGIQAASSPMERQPLLEKLATLLSTDRPVLFLYRHSNVALISTKVHGVSASSDRLDFRLAWIEQ
jgi:peptide/nickel transport system substrate-binding protein